MKMRRRTREVQNLTSETCGEFPHGVTWRELIAYLLHGPDLHPNFGVDLFCSEVTFRVIENERQCKLPRGN